MPRKKRVAKRRPRRKKAYKGFNPRSLTGFPSSAKYHFRYADTLSLATTLGGTPAKYSYSANSLFDPDTTGIGHQPLGYDQATVYYNKYMVLGSKITVKYALDNPTANYVSPIGIGVYISDDTFTPNSVVSMVEQGLGRWSVMSASNTRGTDFKQVSNTYSPKRFFKVKDPMDNTIEYGALVSSSPANQAFFSIWVGNLDAGVGDITNVTMLITIEYTAIFYEPKTLNQS